MFLRDTIWFYILPLVVSFIIIHPLVWWVRSWAIKNKVEDVADVPRKIQRGPVPLLGGAAIFLGLIISLVLFYYLGFLTDIKIPPVFLLGIFGAALILVIGGILDDKYNLKPGQQIWWPILASLVILLVGIKINYITNPLGGILYLDKWQVTIGTLIFLPLAQGLAFLWLMGMIYTTKFLDGLDGLVSGITVIGAVIIFIVSLSWDVPRSGTSALALIVAGLFGGFLIWNFYKAKIFLGEAGATLAGLLLGVLSIISGGKIATALLVVGLPILDVAWVIFRRMFWERKSPAQADRKHLHFRLLDAGLTHRQTVLLLYLIAALFGSLSLFNTTKGKIILFGLLSLGMVVLAIYLVCRYKKIQAKNEN